MECFDNIVGVTADPCECATGSLTVEQKEELAKSESGFYFLDNISDSINPRALKNAGDCKTFYDMTMQAKKSAVGLFVDDLLTALSTKYKQGKGKFSGMVGKSTYSGNIPQDTGLHFLKVFYPEGKTDTVLTLNSVRLFSSAPTSGADPREFTFFIFKDNAGEVSEIFRHSGNMPATGQAIVAMPEPTVLPLYEDSRAISYIFAWVPPVGASVRDNKLSCGCSGGDGWQKFFSVHGGHIDSVDSILIGLTGRNDLKAHGIVLNLTASCETKRFICREYNETNAVALVAKYAIAFKANEMLNEMVLGSDNVNRFTMMNREHLYGKRNHFRAEYNSRIEWLLQNIDIAGADCFVCRDNRLYLGGIVS